MYLAERGHIERMDAGLSGARGAQEVIAAITTRRTVSKLILGHNELGDPGCITLFQFLSSDVGRAYRIREISLNANNIGNAGLLAIASYLSDNDCLKELFLQNNAFVGDPRVASAFVDGLNKSHLEFLSLTTNRGLSDTFVAVFLTSLNCPSLREMHLSAIDMGRRSVRHLASYIASKCCQLHTLKCNGNSLGYRGVKKIIRAMEKSNYSLTAVELYSNQLADGAGDSTDDSGSATPAPTSSEAWKDAEARMVEILNRNRRLKRETEKQAFQLLRSSRPLLLPSHASSSSSCSKLPIELHYHILSFISPKLSISQQLNIFQFAGDRQTLPKLLPNLNVWSLNNNPSCVPDPLSLGFSPLGVGGVSGGCSGGKCLGRMGCRRDQERESWLKVVGCSAYDPS